MWHDVYEQNEKRQLETAMVVESRIHNKNRVSSRRSLGDTADAFDHSEVCPPNRTARLLN